MKPNAKTQTEEKYQLYKTIYSANPLGVVSTFRFEALKLTLLFQSRLTFEAPSAQGLSAAIYLSGLFLQPEILMCEYIMVQAFKMIIMRKLYMVPDNFKNQGDRVLKFVELVRATSTWEEFTCDGLKLLVFLESGRFLWESRQRVIQEQVMSYILPSYAISLILRSLVLIKRCRSRWPALP